MIGCFNYSQLSDYNHTEWLVKSKTANAPITFEEIEIVMIMSVIVCMFNKSWVQL